MQTHRVGACMISASGQFRKKKSLLVPNWFLWGMRVPWKIWINSFLRRLSSAPCNVMSNEEVVNIYGAQCTLCRAWRKWTNNITENSTTCRYCRSTNIRGLVSLNRFVNIFFLIAGSVVKCLASWKVNSWSKYCTWKAIKAKELITW